MSVSVIYEISQPLTLAMEAAHLPTLTQDLDPDIADSAALVDRKAQALSDLAHRLRRLGGRDLDEPSPLPVAMLVQTTCQVVVAEARGSGGRLACKAVDPNLAATFARLLARNGVAACPFVVSQEILGALPRFIFGCVVSE